MIEIPKACIVAFMKSKKFHGCLMQREEKKTDEGENVFFKALAKNFLLKSKKNLCRPSIKWTSWEGNDKLHYYVILLKID